MARRKKSTSLQGLQSAAGGESVGNGNGDTGYIDTGNSPFEFGAFGPQQKSQGAFGRDLSLTDPQWAQWLDKAHDAGVAGFGADNEPAINDPFWVGHANQAQYARTNVPRVSDARLAALRKQSTLGGS